MIFDELRWESHSLLIGDSSFDLYIIKVDVVSSARDGLNSRTLVLNPIGRSAISDSQSKKIANFM